MHDYQKVDTLRLPSGSTWAKLSHETKLNFQVCTFKDHFKDVLDGLHLSLYATGCTRSWMTNDVGAKEEEADSNICPQSHPTLFCVSFSLFFLRKSFGHFY